MIESVQKRVGRKFSPEEIETGILKDLITDADYDIIRVVCIQKCASRIQVCSRLGPNCIRIQMLYCRTRFIERRTEPGPS